MKFLLLYNPMSGRANFNRKIKRVNKIFNKTNHHIDYCESKYPDDLFNTVQKEAKNYDAFLVSGGDGTVNEVVNGIMTLDKKIPLGILPSGTANDIAAILGFNKNLKKSLKNIFQNEIVNIDVHKLNEKYFVYTTASGMLSKISYDISRRRVRKYGYIAYMIEAMKDFRKDYKYKITVKYDDNIETHEVVMVLGLGSNRVGGVKLINFSKSKLNDGLFNLRLYLHTKSFWRFRIFQSFLRGGRRIGEDIHIESSKFIIETDKEVRWNIDGEYACNGSVEINTIRAVLPVFTTKWVKKKKLL